MKRVSVLVLAGAALLVSGCATTSVRQGPVDVMRYHLDAAIPPDSISVEPQSGADQLSPESRLYIDAVTRQLALLGFAATPVGGTTPAGGPAPAGNSNSAYIASVAFHRIDRGTVRDRPPVSVGLGGGGFGGGRGGGFGMGGGVSFGVGGRSHAQVSWELAVQLRRRSDQTMVWEGRARFESLETVGQNPEQRDADRLAAALFKDFPGESGISARVK